MKLIEGRKGAKDRISFDFSGYTEEEMNEIVGEIAERMRDVVDAQADVKALGCLKDAASGGFWMREGDEFTITYKINFSYLFLVQILSRMRRKKKGRKKLPWAKTSSE